MRSEFRLIGLFSLAATCVYRIKSPEISETLILSQEETNTTCELCFFIIVLAEALTFSSAHYTWRRGSDWIISPCKKNHRGSSNSTQTLFFKHKPSKFLMKIKIEAILAFIIVILFHFIWNIMRWMWLLSWTKCEKYIIYIFFATDFIYFNRNITSILYNWVRIFFFIYSSCIQSESGEEYV